MIRTEENIIDIDGAKIRRYFDEKSSRWYFSITDVLGIATDSSDPRNYWKVLKNRLKKSSKQEQQELVTNCNQLKMLSNDGKMYLTDAALSDTMLEIIKITSLPAVRPFRVWFESIESSDGHGKSTALDTENIDTELMVDAYQTKTHIIISAMIAGVLPSNLSISVNSKTIIIKGERLLSESITSNDFLTQEIYWGMFSRVIDLPALIDIDSVLVELSHGLLTIQLPKIDLDRNRIMKVK